MLGYGGKLPQWALTKAMKDSHFNDMLDLAKRLGAGKQAEEKDLGQKLVDQLYEKGKYNEEKPTNLSDKQLDMGQKVEMEHTTNKGFSRRIAKDHVTEFPDYYTRLDKMEEEAKKFWDKKGSMFKKAWVFKKKTKIAGGPGSNSAEDVHLIVEDYPTLEVSDKISIGKRKEFMSKRTPMRKDVEIPTADIKFVGQQKYLPTKLKKFIDNPDLLDTPIDVLIDNNRVYHVMDGHHRFLAALKLKRDTIKANVYTE
jgi:polyhydroxyalkanoate synthesis regulator phasin